jgi:hypothetical protein
MQALIVAVALVLGSPVQTAPQVAHGNDYASAYADCAAHGWDYPTVNQCRWAAYRHFGYSMLLALHKPTEA